MRPLKSIWRVVLSLRGHSAAGVQPPLALTDVRRLRGTLGREGCEDNEIQNVETKALRKCGEGNTADCTSDEARGGEGGGGRGRGSEEG